MITIGGVCEKTSYDRRISMKTITIPAQMIYLDSILDMIQSSLTAFSCTEKELNQICISVEEIFTNIVSYGYGSEKEICDDMVSVSCFAESKETKTIVWIQISDSGIPYDPLKYPAPDFDLPLEELRIGGLGIHMVKKMMDFVTYKFENGYNILTIGKIL